MSILAATAASLSLAAGKLLNNTNAALPGYTISVSGSLPVYRRLSLDGTYLRVGKSQLAENMAITSVGLGYVYKNLHITAAEILVAAASPVVWWYSDEHGEGFCQIGGGNDSRCKRYSHGAELSRACRNCGEEVSLSYTTCSGWGIKASYYGLLHMKPTFQGVVMQVSYTFGGR